MLKNRLISGVGMRGDTLIEVTVALAILSMVLMGSAAVATSSFRMGQTARERTALVEAAQEQLEALHNFRDNHSWAEFQGGSGCGVGGYCGIDYASSQPWATCKSDSTKKCFYMQKYPKPSTGGQPWGWVPVPGTLNNSPADPDSTNLTVPTSFVEITLSSDNTPLTKGCEYDFDLHYAFTPLGASQLATNEIKTRLSNLKYSGGPGGCLP